MAAPNFNICGWERGDSTEAQATTGTFSVQSTTKRTGTYALRCNPASGAQGYHTLGGYLNTGVHTNLGRTAETFYTVHFQFSSLPSVTTRFCSVRNAAALEVVGLNVDSSGNITLVGTTTSSTIATVSTGVWYRLDVRCTSNATSGAKIDGGTEQTVTAQNVTQNYFFLGRSTTEGTALDVYFDDAAISSAEIGTGRCQMLSTTGDGTYTAWGDGTGATEAEVDETPHDTDTTYIKALATGDNTARTFAMENTATVGITGTIHTVKPCCMVRSESTSGASSVGVRLRSGSTNSDTTAREWGTTYTLDAQILTTDPNGGGAWTSGGVDGIEVGVYAGTLAQAQRCTSVSAMVWSDGVESYSATASLTAGSATASATATFSPGTKTASASLTVGSATLSGTADVTNPTYSATSDLAVGAATLSSSATFAMPTFSATASLAAGTVTLSANAEFDAPVYSASSALTVGATELSAAAEFDAPVYAATAALVVGVTTLSSSAEFDVPVYSATVALVVGVTTLSSNAEFDAPVYSATTALIVGAIGLSGAAEFDAPVYSAMSALVVGVTTLSASARTEFTYSASADLLTSVVQFACTATFISIADGPPGEFDGVTHRDALFFIEPAHDLFTLASYRDLMISEPGTG